MSRTERLDPNRAREKSVKELPYLPKLRKESELPSCKKSRTDTDEPNLVIA
jgi:hypothetical protein